MNIPTPLPPEVLEAIEKMIALRNIFAYNSEHPHGLGPGARRAYSNRAYGITAALEILDEAFKEE
jgi:hypothetical protein